MLETLEAATSRRAVIHAEILGKGSTSEANGLLPVRADGNGIARAIRLALEQAGLEREQIGMIVCHGNGTQLSDRSEGAALRSIFGSSCPPITCFKWAFGHTIAASGCIDTILTIQALNHKIVPAIPIVKGIDAYFQDLPITTANTRPTSDCALVLSRGFGSQNSALVVRGCY
jgi:3-oxoacyl-(acyl-carrier-protein) synthase